MTAQAVQKVPFPGVYGGTNWGGPWQGPDRVHL